MGERGTNRLSQDQLAEGARLLEAKNTQGMSYDAFMSAANKLNAWLYNHAVALLSSARRVAEVEGCLRELKESFTLHRCEWRQLADETNLKSLRQERVARATEWSDACNEVIEIATRHNIDLSEPWTKPPKGQQEGGDCHA